MTVARGKRKRESNERIGLSIATKIHMFLNVFGKTPGFCSSTKFALVSNPVIPNYHIKEQEEAK